MKPIHIFRAGTYTAMSGDQVTIGANDLAASARAYDTRKHEAPIVVGHPQTDSPAYGWVATLGAHGDDLVAVAKDVNPDFAEAVKKRTYDKRSASFYPPAHNDNPVPGVWYLKHVGFLGGAAPAVKGLRQAELAEDGDLVVIEFALPAEGQTQPKGQNMPKKEQTQGGAESTADLAERKQQLDERENKLAERERRLKEREEQARREEIQSFCETLASEARIRPADVSALTALIAGMDEQKSLAFAESGKTEPRDATTWFRAWLAGMPPLVELGESATKGRAAQKKQTNAAEDAAIARRARVFRRKMIDSGQPMSFGEAVRAVEANADREQ